MKEAVTGRQEMMRTEKAGRARSPQTACRPTHEQRLGNVSRGIGLRRREVDLGAVGPVIHLHYCWAGRLTVSFGGRRRERGGGEGEGRER